MHADLHHVSWSLEVFGSTFGSQLIRQVDAHGCEKWIAAREYMQTDAWREACENLQLVPMSLSERPRLGSKPC